MAVEKHQQANSADPVPEYRFDPVTLRFRNPATETDFVRSWSVASTEAVRYWVLGSALFYLAITAVYQTVYDQDFLDFDAARLVFCVPVKLAGALATLIGLWSIRAFDIYYLSTSIVIFANAAFCYVIADPGDRVLYLLEMAAIYAYCHSFPGARFTHILAFNFVASATAVAAFVFVSLVRPEPALPLSLELFVLLGLALSGVFGAYSREMMTRLNFRRVRLAEAAQAEAGELARAASSAADSKARFLAIMGHELRTPLNAIIGYAEMIRFGILGEVRPERAVRDAESIGDRARDLHGRVEDIIEISQATDEPMLPRAGDFEVGQALEAARSRLNSVIASGRATIEVSENGLHHLVADERMIGLALDYVLGDVLVGAPLGTQVRLSAATMAGGDLEVAASRAERPAAEAGTARPDIRRHLVRQIVAAHGGATSYFEDGLGVWRVAIRFPADRVSVTGRRGAGAP